MTRTIVLTLLFWPGLVWSEEIEHYQHVQLYTGCAPVVYMVEDIDEAEVIGLTTEAISNLVELKLRSARLYGDEYRFDKAGTDYLYVNVFTLKNSFFLGIEFKRAAMPLGVGLDPEGRDLNEFANFYTYATFWQKYFIGRGDADYILGGLSKDLDKFLLAYLKVNEEACNKKSADAPQ